jgi:hypothetical protein
MAASPELKKKTEMDQYAKIINTWIEQAMKSREGLTPENLRNYENIGQEARQKQLRESTPSKQIGGIVARRSEEKVRPEVAVKVGHREMEASIDLATSLEIAATTGKRLDLASWVRGKEKG